MPTAFLAALLSWLGSPGVALAQGDGETTLLEEDDDVEDDDETVLLESENAPLGASENPDASLEFGNRELEAKPTVDADTGPYPLELTRRPLTLPRNTFEGRLELVAIVEHVQLQNRIKVAYGITDEVQLALGYGGGTLSAHDVYVPYLVGKTVEVEARYRLTSWAAAQIAVPLWVDPVAVGVRLGVPLRFRVFGKLALLFGEDFLTFKAYRFFPRLSDTIYNRDRVQDVNTNTLTSDGELRFVGAVQYQYTPKTTLVAEFGFVATRFSTEDPIVPMRVFVNHSPSPKMDLGLRAGFNNLDRAVKELGILITLGYRI